MQLKNMNTVRKKRADGTYVSYYYAWKGGPRLIGEPGTPEFKRSYFKAIEDREDRPREPVFSAIIDAYLASDEYRKLAPRSSDDYAKYAGWIREKFGSMPLGGFAEEEARGDFLEWRDEIAIRSPRAADYAWTVLRRIVTWAHDRRKIRANPCTRAGRAYQGAQRVDSIWTDAHEAVFMQTASPQMRLGFLIAVWTGQRQGDILKLSWRSYDGMHIRLRQSKTRRHVIVRAGEPLRALLNATLVERHAQRVGADTITVADLRALQDDPILMTRDRRRFTSFGFSCSFRKTRERAGVKGLTFHDLRGTTVTRLGELGATAIEIAAVTGHSVSDVESILDSHYLSRTQLMSDNAIDRLERRKAVVDVSQLPPNSQISTKRVIVSY